MTLFGIISPKATAGYEHSNINDLSTGLLGDFIPLRLQLFTEILHETRPLRWRRRVSDQVGC